MGEVAMPKFERPITLDDLRERGPVPPPRHVLPQRQILTDAEQAELQRHAEKVARARHAQLLRQLNGVYVDARNSGLSPERARKAAVRSIGAAEEKGLSWRR